MRGGKPSKRNVYTMKTDFLSLVFIQNHIMLIIPLRQKKVSSVSCLLSLLLFVCGGFLLVLFLLDFIFWSSLRFTGILSRGYRDFPYISYPTLDTSCPTKNFPYQSSSFVTTDEPTLTHQVSSSIFF